MEIDFTFRLLAFLVLIGLSAGFSASETAFFSLSKPRLQAFRLKGSPIERHIFSLLDRPRRLIISILMGNEIVNIAASVVFTGSMVAIFGEQKGRYWAILMIPILLVFGEVTPKSLAARFPEQFSRALVFPLKVFAGAIFPLRWVFLQISNGVLRLMGAPPRAPSNILLEDEFLTLVDVSHEEGELGATERTYIRNIFEFHDRRVGEVIVPRTDMLCWEAELPLAEVASRLRNTPHSRIPIYRGDRDHIEGILYAKDFLRTTRRKNFEPDEVLTENLLRRPLVVPEGLKLDELFRVFRRRRTHIAIVADEYGGVAGLVTMTDLLEEIFGEIRDEYDINEDRDIQPLPGGAYLCQAVTTLNDFTEVTGWSLPGEIEANSLGGFVFTLLGRIPRPRERVYSGDLEITVLEVQENRIVRLRVSQRGRAGT